MIKELKVIFNLPIHNNSHMRFILATLLIATIGFIAGVYLPWWSIAIVSFLIVLLIPLTAGKGFLAGFTGIFILWAFIASWIDIKNESLLSQKVAELFHLGSSS